MVKEYQPPSSSWPLEAPSLASALSICKFVSEVSYVGFNPGQRSFGFHIEFFQADYTFYQQGIISVLTAIALWLSILKTTLSPD